MGLTLRSIFFSSTMGCETRYGQQSFQIETSFITETPRLKTGLSLQIVVKNVVVAFPIVNGVAATDDDDDDDGIGNCH